MCLLHADFDRQRCTECQETARTSLYGQDRCTVRVCAAYPIQHNMTIKKEIRKDIRRDIRRGLRGGKHRLGRKPHSRLTPAAHNVYLQALIDPANNLGARVPDDDVRATATNQARMTWDVSAIDTGAPPNSPTGHASSPLPSHLANYGTHAYAMLVAPTTRNNRVYNTYGYAAAGPSPLGTVFAWDDSAAFLEDTWTTDTIDTMETTAAGIRVVSASLEVAYTGPALEAKGSYVLAPVNANQQVQYIATAGAVTREDYFDGTVDGASQLVNSVAYPAAQSSKVTWRPTDVSSHIYSEERGSGSQDRKFRGFTQSSNICEPYVNVSGIAIDYFYFCANDLAASASFQFTLTVNWEWVPRLAQLNSGARLSLYSPNNLAQATNIGALVPQVMETTDRDGSALPDGHPVTEIETAAHSAAMELATAATPKAQEDAVTGRSFLSKLGDTALEYLPKVAEAIPSLLAML